MNKNISKRYAQILFWFIVQSGLLFLSAGTVKWLWAWVMICAYICLLIVNSIVLPRDVIEERGRKKDNVKKWDKVLTTLGAVPMLGVYVVAGLDYRFMWSPDLAAVIHIISLILFLLGFLLATWAMVSNRFFSTMVRLQTEQGHAVATGGPYRFVRHPGYVGFNISSITLPLVLGSLYGLILAAFSVVIMIIRTALEDKTLQAELEGYADYAEQVRYRLIPYVW
ncbi:MAG: isoprenylcysteine carboxylmethyltransferase family protein [Spirochaetes bacterium]|nr:isoprenylcysteine carboxylmethyltransferase family protein [Spirochaetota bacterium]